VSSNTIITTFGAPGVARTICRHAGLDSSVVLPIIPENALPGLYSLGSIGWSSSAAATGLRLTRRLMAPYVLIPPE
jgi:hypothetical protein